MQRMVEGAASARHMHENLLDVLRGVERAVALPPSARFARHLPRCAGEEPLLGS
jgi:hypothetical protein